MSKKPMILDTLDSEEGLMFVRMNGQVEVYLTTDPETYGYILDSEIEDAGSAGHGVSLQFAEVSASTMVRVFNWVRGA